MLKPAVFKSKAISRLCGENAGKRANFTLGCCSTEKPCARTCKAETQKEKTPAGCGREEA
ncbi:MAG: hypothetical protein C4324_12165 [Blastocatellia bacterium]